MERITAQQLNVYLNKLNGEEGDGIVWILDQYAESKKQEDELLGKVVKVHEKGGFEGKGDEVYWVYLLSDRGQYFGVEGWYSSDNGSEFDNEFYEVFPHQKMITVYNKVPTESTLQQEIPLDSWGNPVRTSVEDSWSSNEEESDSY